MPRGPKGEKRPADVIGSAVMVGRIAIGELREEVERKKESEVAAAMGRKGGKARAANLSAKERRRIATNAAATRWKKKKSTR